MMEILESAEAQASGLGAAADRAFAGLHTTLLQSQCEGLRQETLNSDAPPRPYGKKRVPNCRDLGFCACTAQGYDLYRFWGVAKDSGGFLDPQNAAT